MGVFYGHVLIACEFSGIVRDAFLDGGYNADSVDLLETESTRPGDHWQCDIIEHLDETEPNYYDMMIAFPPCTYLCSSGLHWNKRRPERAEKTEESLRFIKALMEAEIPRIAIENPIGCISTRIRKPAQIIQPWQFGHGETKSTCLWLKNLPPLQPTNVVEGREQRVWKMPPGEDRSKDRSRTYLGIARAMVKQWGPLMENTIRYGDKVTIKPL